jgi:aryl-alcohol dehydrogenase-like predicted oxidoreductase
LDPSDFRARNPRFTGDASRQNQVIADTVRTVAGRLGVLPAQVALAWVYAQAPRLGVSVVPIPGTRHANRLDENAASLDVELDDVSMLSWMTTRSRSCNPSVTWSRADVTPITACAEKLRCPTSENPNCSGQFGSRLR